MATHDGSLASQVEDWMVTQLQTIDDLHDEHVELYGGVVKFEAALQVIEDIRRKRNPHILVIYDGFIPLDLRAEGDQDPVLQFTLWISNSNKREGGFYARRGESTSKVGTNLLTEKVWSVLDNKFPELSTTLLRSGPTRVEPGQSLTLEKGFSLVQMTVTVRCEKA